MNEFARYVTLSILGQLGISCYIIADTFFISKGLGANGLTALNLAIPIYNFIFGCGLMLGVGGATKFSILKGMKHTKETDVIYSNTVILTVILSAVFGPIPFIAPEERYLSIVPESEGISFSKEISFNCFP